MVSIPLLGRHPVRVAIIPSEMAKVTISAGLTGRSSSLSRRNLAKHTPLDSVTTRYLHSFFSTHAAHKYAKHAEQVPASALVWLPYHGFFPRVVAPRCGCGLIWKRGCPWPRTRGFPPCSTTVQSGQPRSRLAACLITREWLLQHSVNCAAVIVLWLLPSTVGTRLITWYHGMQRGA